MENRIRELREKRRMNQETLAGFVGVSQQTISKVERNTEALCIGLLIEISDFFSVTTDYLLGLSDEKRNLLMENRVNRKIENYYDLIVEFEELNENNKNTVNVMIRALKAAQTDGVLQEMSPFARLSEEQREQIREIYEKNYIKLYQKAYGILNHSEDAEDVLHDSIIKLMEHYEKYQHLDNEKMTALCKTIVKNRSIDILRQRCRFVDRKEIETLWDKTEPDVYSHIKKKYEEEWFREELEILSQPLQEVVVLKYCYEYRNPEIAKILGVTLRTVEMRLERAKQRIRRETED